MLDNQECQRVVRRRGFRLDNGTRLDDDELCPKYAVTDVIVTFNGNAYIVPLCAEHKSMHDQAAADRRKRRPSNRTPQAQRATQNYEGLLDEAMTRVGRR